jgi:hypothetical protein
MEFVVPSASFSSTSVSSSSGDGARAYDQQLLSICRVDVPLMKVIPKREVSMFARTWGGLLNSALELQNPESWFDFFSFPKEYLVECRERRSPDHERARRLM